MSGVRYAIQDKLFQPFQRLHTSKDYSGTGIGLATALRVIRRTVEILVESEMGKGRLFILLWNNNHDCENEQ